MNPKNTKNGSGRNHRQGSESAENWSEQSPGHADGKVYSCQGPQCGLGQDVWCESALS